MIDRDEVERVAENARLDVDDEEIDALQEDFESILESFESLDEIDTEGVEPSFHPVEGEDGNTRSDEPEECFSREETFANTDNEEDGFFKGPRAT